LKFKEIVNLSLLFVNRIKGVLLHDKGWSVSQIAEALLLSEEAIRDHVAEYKQSKNLNHLTSDDLNPGDVLALPPGVAYEVQPGDSLFKIAQTMGITLASLEAANPGVSSNLQPGQILALPPSTTAA